MKQKELIKQLEAVQRHKSRLKALQQESFDLLHQIETGVQIILLELYKERKKK